MQDARSVRERQAQGLSAGALLICTVVFLVISVSSYGVFGKGVDADIIGNYTVDALSKLVWPDLAQAGFFGIRLGVLVALTLSFPLHVRTVIVWGGNEKRGKRGIAFLSRRKKGDQNPATIA